MTFATLELPKIAPVRQWHGLWTSAYHLVHPANAQPFSTGREDFTANNSYEPTSLEIFDTPFNGRPLKDKYSDREIGLHVGAGFEYQPECPGEAGCWHPCTDACQDPEDPEKVKVPDCAEGIEQYSPTLITSTITCSTFGFEAADYFGRAERSLRKIRSSQLECNLWEGDCAVDDEGTPLNPYFSQAAADSGVTILADGEPQTAHAALQALNGALAECNPGEAGMIHAPVELASKWCTSDCVAPRSMDYGDGMGERPLLQTTVRGNIIVTGPGYGKCIGPDGEVPGPNQAWVFATPMVYLVWDNVRFTPDNLKDATNKKINQVTVTAEQMIGAFYEPCCFFAVLVDLCA